MTVFLVSLFLPYTIDFKATAVKHARRKSSNSHSSVDDRVVGRLPESRRKGHSKSLSQCPTPRATADYEKAFNSYASRPAAEIPYTDDPNGPGPSEPLSVSWGRSRKFNQPRSTAAVHPKPSILNRARSNDEPKTQSFFVGAEQNPDSDEERGSPTALLSDVDWVVKAAEQGNGALRNAVHAAEEAGLLPNKMWVGTLGMPTDLLKDETRARIADKLEDEFESLAVFTGDSQFDGHYSHFCRSVLWPAFHYQMQESPRHTEYDDYSWKQYKRVNQKFANIIAAHWRPGDSIWIHDYHLLLLPSLLRARLPDAEIGFFMHAAFPSSEVFRCLNARNALLRGLLGADLVGFQTEEYCHHFLQTCSRLLSLEVTVDGVQLNRRFVQVKNFPFGIDSKTLDELRQRPEVREWMGNICSRYQGKRLIVARDRLDGPGGIKQKLLSYELFLKRYPEWRENVVLIQVASSGAELPELEAEVSKIAMRVNSSHSTLTHQPLVLMRQDMSYSRLLALMSVADIFMVTSLREGMNLTSHEYLHCQDGKIASQRHGSLILSEFAGTASIFSGHELLVNPWDYKQCTDAIREALEMSPEQKQHNWQFLLDRKAPHTAVAWFKLFYNALSTAHGLQPSREPSQVSSLSINALKGSYDRSKLRLFFLEDKGIIGSVASAPSPKSSGSLKDLLHDPKNLVYVTSNRSPEQLGPLTKKLSTRVGYIAENGCFKREIGSSKWETLADMDATRDWRIGIRKVIEYFQERTEGSWIEERRCLLTFWYKDAHDPEVGARQASELADQISGSRGSEAIRVVLTKGAVSVEPLDVSKATAAELIIQSLPQNRRPDFLFVAGGARGDEALFRWANSQTRQNVPHVTTLTVGSHATQAKSILPSDMSIAGIVSALIF